MLVLPVLVRFLLEFRQVILAVPAEHLVMHEYLSAMGALDRFHAPDYSISVNKFNCFVGRKNYS